MTEEEQVSVLLIMLRCAMQRQQNVQIILVPHMEFIGRIWMKIYLTKVFLHINNTSACEGNSKPSLTDVKQKDMMKYSRLRFIGHFGM